LRDALIGAPARVDRPRGFCASGELPMTMPGLTVDGFGKLSLPLGDPRRVLGGPPRLDPKALKRVVADLKAAVARRDGASAGSSMRELMALMRAAAREALRSHRSNANETPFSHYSNTREANS